MKRWWKDNSVNACLMLWMAIAILCLLFSGPPVKLKHPAPWWADSGFDRRP